MDGAVPEAPAHGAGVCAAADQLRVRRRDIEPSLRS